MAVLTPHVTVSPYYARNSGGQLCSHDEDVYSIDDFRGNGATITPPTTLRLKVRVMGGRKRFYCPDGAGATVSRVTITLASARRYDRVAHLIAFEPAYSALNGVTSYCPLSTISTAAGAQWRLSVSARLETSPYSGTMFTVDSAQRVLDIYGGGCYSSNGGPVHVCNIATFRSISDTTAALMINGTSAETAVAQSAASGTTTGFYLGSHNSTPLTFNMAGGYIDIWHLYDSSPSQANMIDTYNSERAALPFFVDVDWTQPVLLGKGTSSMAGVYTTTASTWWRKQFITDVLTNYPDGVPQTLIMGHPGNGFLTLPTSFAELLSGIPANAARPILFASGAVSDIRSSGQTPAATYALCKAWKDSFLAACPNGIFITDSTSPSATENADLEAYDALLYAQFDPDGVIGGNIQKGNGGDFGTNCYMVNFRGNSVIGGDGDDTTGAAGQYSDVDWTGNSPTNVRNRYHSDGNHRKGTDATRPGQTEYSNELLPLNQVVLAAIEDEPEPPASTRPRGSLVGSLLFGGRARN